MKLALQNLIISEVTCQEWKSAETIKKNKLSASKSHQKPGSCSIELLSHPIITTGDCHSIN